MWPQILTALFSLIDKVLPDPQAAAAAKLEAMKMQDSAAGRALEADTKLALAQIAVNTADAQSGNTMQSTGRPFILWVCGVAMAWDTVIRPMVTFGAALTGHLLPDLPNLSSDQLYAILGGLLGLGTLRTVEKVRNSA